MRSQDMMSLEQIAKHLSLPAHKVEAMFKSGELPGSVEDGQWTASRNAVESWRMNSGLGSVMRAWGGSPTPAKKPDPPAPVPQSWQQPSTTKSSSGFGGASPRELAAQARNAKLPPPPPPLKPSIPQPMLVNEQVQTTPASLELDLSILERLDIPEPDEDGSEGSEDSQ